MVARAQLRCINRSLRNAIATPRRPASIPSGNAYDCGHHDPPMRADMVNGRLLSRACNQWLDKSAPELCSAALDSRNR